MDPQQALADLTEISSQIRSAVLFDGSGDVLASTLDDEARAKELADAAGRLLEAAEQVRAGGEQPMTQLEAATREGSVFVVLDGLRRLAATTAPEPTVGLVFYDLKSCLRQLDEEQEAPAAKRPARAKRERVERAPGSERGAGGRKDDAA
jgi:predicted regulator of Ras-like GTPase activity (Roadblock/LC7/MglB family)